MDKILLIGLYVLQANGINIPTGVKIGAWVWFGLAVLTAFLNALPKEK